MYSFCRERFTIVYRGRDFPIFRVHVSAPQNLMTQTVSRLAKATVGQHGRAVRGYIGPSSVPEFAVAVGEGDGAVQGAGRIVEWIKEALGGAGDHHIDPNAVVTMCAWREAEGQAVNDLMSYGLDADGKLSRKIDAQDEAQALLTHRARKGHGGNGPRHHLERHLQRVLRNGGAQT